MSMCEKGKEHTTDKNKGLHDVCMCCVWGVKRGEERERERSERRSEESDGGYELVDEEEEER